MLWHGPALDTILLSEMGVNSVSSRPDPADRLLEGRNLIKYQIRCFQQSNRLLFSRKLGIKVPNMYVTKRLVCDLESSQDTSETRRAGPMVLT